MSFSIIRKLEGKELTDEKIRDFRRLLAVQVAVISSLFFLEFIETHNLRYYEIVETYFFITLGLYVFLLWDMLRNYTSSKALIIANLIFIMGVFIASTVVVNPFVEVVDHAGPAYKPLLLLTQVSLLSVESVVIYFTLREFFNKDLNMSIRLWGVACIYLMIGFAFGSAYELLCIVDVDCLGADIPLRTLALMKRMSYSLMVLAGVDTPYDAPTGVIYFMSTLEALWNQVFVVLIVGRLMMK